MLRRTLVLMIVFLAGLVGAFADDNNGLQKNISQQNAPSWFKAYEQKYSLSVLDGSVDRPLQILNEWLAETRRRNIADGEAYVLMVRSSFFYNNDMNDSIYKHVPEDLTLVKGYSEWGYYFQMWANLVNTYIYGDKASIGLHEVQKMFAEAEELHNAYGMGLSYACMGNAYMALGNAEESVSSYRKGLDLLVKMPEQPTVILEIYPNYADVLNDQADYDQLEKLTTEWKDFLTRFIRNNAGQLTEDSYQVAIYWSYYYIAETQAFLGKRNLDRAETALDEVRKRLLSGDNYLGQKYLYYCAQLSFLKGNYTEALSLNGRRMMQMESTDDKSVLVMVRKQRAEIMWQLGRFADAAKLYRDMYQITDSINQHDIRKQLNEMNTLFHVNEIEQEKQRKVNEVKMQQQREQYYFVIIVASVILIALVVFLVFRMKAAKRLKVAHDKLEQAHSDLLVAYDNLEETTAAKERIESDLRIARDIQMSMVPSVFPERPDLDLYASMTPAKEVGGDLYDFLILDDNLYFALGDVSGKGVPASLFMAQATRLFHTLAKLKMKPAEIATRLNEELSAENDQGMFVTMFLGAVDLTTGHLQFCNAGHNPPVLVSTSPSEGKASPSPSEGGELSSATFLDMIPNAPIGLWPGLDYEGEEIDSITGKPLFIYTDGLNEAENRQQEQFTDERLLELLQTRPYESARQTIEMLRDEVEKHRDGAEPNDDLTMLCFKVIDKLN